MQAVRSLSAGAITLWSEPIITSGHPGTDLLPITACYEQHLRLRNRASA